MAKLPAAKKVAPKATTEKAAPEPAKPKTTQPKLEPAVEIPDLPLADIREHLNILYVGDWGSGKTTDLATMANLGRVLFISAESGLEVRALRKHGINIDNIMVRPNIEAGEALTYELLDRMFWRLKSDLEDDPESWAGVVWDSATDIHLKLLGRVRDYQLERAERAGRARMKDEEPGGMLDQFFTDLSDYGVMTEQMRLLLRRYRDLPCHFGVSTLAKKTKNDEGKLVLDPAITPALANDIGGYVKVVCYTALDEVGGEIEYQGWFRELRRFRGKDRTGTLPKALVDPTFERVWAYYQEEITVETDPVMQEAAERRAKNPPPVKDEDEGEEVEPTGDTADDEAA